MRRVLVPAKAMEETKGGKATMSGRDEDNNMVECTVRHTCFPPVSLSLTHSLTHMIFPHFPPSRQFACAGHLAHPVCPGYAAAPDPHDVFMTVASRE